MFDVELWIPVFVVVLFSVIVPAALILVAVIASIISKLSTVAPLINTSSTSDLISYKEPKFCVACVGTIINVTISGDNSFITYVDNSLK